MEKQRGGGAWQREDVIQFPPLPAQLFSSPARKADHQFSFPCGPQPRTHTVLGRDLPREFHIGNGQVRRNAGGGVPGTTPPRMGLRLCGPTVICSSARCLAPPAGGGGFSAERTQSVPAGLGEMRTWGWALQLRIARVCSLSRYCEAVVLNVSLFDLQELKFSCHQIILKY